MVEQRSRLQLLDELRRLDQTHAATVSGLHGMVADSTGLDGLFERYSYAELQVIVDYLSSDIARLQSASAGEFHVSR